MASVTWTKSSGTAQWKSTADWSTSALPGTGDTAVFGAGGVANVTANVSIAELDVAVGGVNVVSGKTLDLTGALIVTGGAVNVGNPLVSGAGHLTANAATVSGGVLNIATGGTSASPGLATGTVTIATNLALSAGGAITVGGSRNAGSLSVIGSLTESGGSLTLVSGSISLGTLNQTGGAVEVTAGILDIGTLSQTGGAIDITDGTLKIDTGASSGARIDLGVAADHGTVIWGGASSGLSNLTLNNFFAGDKLELLANGLTGAVSYDSTTHMLTLGTIGGNAVTVRLSHTGNAGQRDYQTSDFTVSSSGGTITVTDSGYPCFLRGTRIATLRGEVAVEDLRIGDLVVTATAGALPIKWIGTRGFITRLVNEHHRAALLPVRIAAGAFGEASPVRDLYVSPEHMLCLDDVLIPAEKLLNGTSITRAGNLDVVQYFHIELPRHAVLYADGAPAESFLDTGNRNMFANVLSYLELGYDLDAPPLPACLPIVTAGETLTAVRAYLAARAAGLGLATTEDDNLHLQVDGSVLRPESRAGDSVRFTVPAGARQVRIVSHSVVLADLEPASGDRRRLGICLSGLSLDDGRRRLDLAPDHAGFASGFHAAEGTHRWTQGDALLPEALTAAMPDGFILELKLVRTGLRYPAPPQADVISLVTRRAVSSHPERLSA